MRAAQTTSLQTEVLLTQSVTCAAVFSLGYIVSQATMPYHSVVALCVATGLLMLVGTGRLRSSLQTIDAVAARLRKFAKTSRADELTPLLDEGSMALGWNRLVDKFSQQNLDAGIERRIAQMAGDRGTERFARALRSLAEGLAITDKHGRISYANSSWTRLVGVDSDSEFVGHSLLSILESAGFENWGECSESVLDGTRPVQLELRRGQHIVEGVLQLSRLPLEGRVQENEGFVWTLRDITQNALASEAHEHFLASATHELRTPLTNIRAYSESLIDMENIEPARQREFFNVIHSEAERLSRLLNELLDLQQLEAGSMTITAATFDVRRMLQEIQENILPLIEQKQLKLVCRIAPDIKSIQADKEKIISTLMNLLGNAIKYTPEHGEVRLIAEQLEQSVSISVEDTGIGISEEEQTKIFDRFYRCQDARVVDIEGNGLGLAFAMEVARLHQGELKVESKLDFGSRFTLRLPLSNPH